MRTSHVLSRSILIIAFSLAASEYAESKPAKKSKPEAAKAVLWRNPGNISRRDLLYGPGSPELAPVGPFTFIEEDKSGESPKFEVRDARGDVWTIKLGPEAQAETVSTRLVWALAGC